MHPPHDPRDPAWIEAVFESLLLPCSGMHTIAFNHGAVAQSRLGRLGACRICAAGGEPFTRVGVGSGTERTAEDHRDDVYRGDPVFCHLHDRRLARAANGAGGEQVVTSHDRERITVARYGSRGRNACISAVLCPRSHFF